MSEETTLIEVLPTSNSQVNGSSAQEHNIKMNIQETPNIVNQVNQNQVNQNQVNQNQVNQNQVQSIISGLQKAAQNGATSLPSRDIPMVQSSVSSDEQIKANYIPEQNNIDYIKNFETEQQIMQNQVVKQNKRDNINSLVTELQLPIIVALLFCILQLPFTKKLMKRYLGFLFKLDGNYNNYGYIGVSMLFGLLYYGITQFLNYIE